MNGMTHVRGILGIEEEAYFSFHSYSPRKGTGVHSVL